MGKVTVTPELKEKVLTAVEEARYENKAENKKQKGGTILSLKRWVPVAAAACLVVVISVFILKINRTGSSSEPMVTGNYTANNASLDESAEAATAEVPEDGMAYSSGPTLLFADGSLYIQTDDQAAYSESDKDLVYIGEVSSVTSDGEEPNQQLQANTDIAGGKVYRLQDDLIVFYQDQCLVFEPLQNETN